MGCLNDFIEKMKKEKKGFAEVWAKGELMRKAIAYRKVVSGLSQIDLAKKINMKQEAISRLENISNPTLTTFIKYLDGLGLELELKEKTKNIKCSKLSEALGEKK